jgi:GntR family transcriptional regulator
MPSEIAIEFYLDAKSGIAPYLQLVHQVRRALKLGALHEGDQLPTVREVVTRIAINPNTVSKAYRELEHEGLVASRAGVGTFVTASTSEDVLASLGPIRHDLEQWLVRARAAGLDEDSIEALFRAAFRNPAPVAS